MRDMEEIRAAHRRVIVEILKGFPAPDPPLTEEEITYLGNYAATASVFEDGSDEGPWISHFLRHRQQVSRLVPHSEYHIDTKEECPSCHCPLLCMCCWIGGGSHYWSLRCPQCKKEFQFDTYRFKLEELIKHDNEIKTPTPPP